MKYMSVSEAAKKWNVTERSVRNYCSNGKVEGAFLQGRVWLIPSEANRPSKNIDDKYLKSAQELVDFINASPVSFLAIDNVSKILNESGYSFKEENKKLKCKVGDKFFLTRNGSALVAVNLGRNISKEYAPIHIVVAHSDSPMFKIKPLSDSKTDIYNKINVEPYGGLLAAPWLDRPLGIAGRVVLKEDDTIISKNINIDEDVVIIPNLCIHFNREANDGYAYNMAKDMQAFIGQELEGEPLKDKLSLYLKTSADNILNFDLYLYNHQKGVIWGKDKEYISSPRLDDLECVFTALTAFKKSNNDNAINILYIADNEEVGSSSRQGADSDFLESVLIKLKDALDFSDADLKEAIANSFMISADNAHAVHPNHPEITDASNKCYMNKGLAIKFNAAQRYTSDSLSAAVFQKICEKAHEPYQFFANRSDIRGGSTLGNILLNHVSFLSVDVGLSQLAMHSCYETAGAKDVLSAINVFSKFYESDIIIDGNKIQIK